MNFTDAGKVQSAITACDNVERERGANRAKINKAANGTPPLSPADAAKMGLKVNFNDCSMAVIFQHGRRQYANAFMSRGRYFKVRLPDAPEQFQSSWQSFITSRINAVMKKSRSYYEVHRSQWASVLCHGIAPKVWWDSDCWRPDYVALEDFRVQTDTKCSMDGLPWFAVREVLTEGQLSQKVFAKYADEGWKKPVVQKILATMHNSINSNQQNFWADAPEKMVELVKQNGGYYASDAAPKVSVWNFFFYDDSDPLDCKWKLRVVMDSTNSGNVASSSEFLFDNGDTAFAGSLDQILHMQFGDLNNRAPFLYHCVRSLGFLLMEPCYWDNITTCRLVQHVNENMNTWLRVSDPTGKARSQLVELMNKGILSDGVTVVPQTERHQVNAQVIEMVQGRMAKLKDEASVSYTQDTEGQNSPDETATAVMARVSSVNAMMSGLLATAFNYETFSYIEICRRFCKKGTTDKDCRKFQQEAREYGIPVSWLDPERWEVEPEIPIGNGNPTMEQVQVQQLMANRMAMPPTAQQEILHEFVIATTGDPRKADAWVPLDKAPRMTQAQEYAELVFSTLMMGVPSRGREELNPVEQAETLIGLMAGVVARIEGTTNMASPAELAGFATTTKFIDDLIQRMMQDQQAAPMAKQFAQQLGQLTNTIKGFAKRAQQSAQQGQEGQQNGEVQAKVAASTITATANARIKESAAAQKMHHTETKFILEQRRQDDKTLAEIEREKAKGLNRIAENMPAPSKVSESIAYADAPHSIQAQMEQQAGMVPAPDSERKEPEPAAPAKN